eukprot:SAG31_NODE_946_length_10832_cov_105.950806_2_plen_87_part_00
MKSSSGVFGLRQAEKVPRTPGLGCVLEFSMEPLPVSPVFIGITVPIRKKPVRYPAGTGTGTLSSHREITSLSWTEPYFKLPEEPRY